MGKKWKKLWLSRKQAEKNVEPVEKHVAVVEKKPVEETVKPKVEKKVKTKVATPVKKTSNYKSNKAKK